MFWRKASTNNTAVKSITYSIHSSSSLHIKITIRWYQKYLNYCYYWHREYYLDHICVHRCVGGCCVVRLLYYIIEQYEGGKQTAQPRIFSRVAEDLGERDRRRGCCHARATKTDPTNDWLLTFLSWLKCVIYESTAAAATAVLLQYCCCSCHAREEDCYRFSYLETRHTTTRDIQTEVGIPGDNWYHRQLLLIGLILLPIAEYVCIHIIRVNEWGARGGLWVADINPLTGAKKKSTTKTTRQRTMTQWARKVQQVRTHKKLHKAASRTAAYMMQRCWHSNIFFVEPPLVPRSF